MRESVPFFRDAVDPSQEQKEKIMETLVQEGTVGTTLEELQGLLKRYEKLSKK